MLHLSSAVEIIMPATSANPARHTVTVRAPDPPRSGARMKLSSATFQPDSTLPGSTAFDGCGGENRSPDLSWSGFPDETRGFALTLFDPDAPTGSGFWHWVLSGIPANVTKLEAGEGQSETAGDGTAGSNDYGAHGYGGPCPPPGDGPHRYVFTIYALDVPTLDGAGRDTTGAKLNFLMRGHVLATGTLTGRYSR